MTRRGWLLFAVMCVVWGIPYLLIKVADEGVSVPVLVFARTAVGAAILLPLAVRRGRLKVLLRHWRPLLAFAAVEIVIPWWLLSDAERRLSSSLSGLLVAAVPIIGVVLARLTGEREHLGGSRWIGLVVGLVGVAVLALPDLGGGDAWAVGEVLLVAVGYATGPLVTARKLRGVPSMVLTAASLTVAAVVYLPAAIVTWPTTRPSGSVIGALVALGVVCTAAAFVLFFELIREAGPARAVVITYINPAIAVIGGVALLGESFTMTMAVSFVLILGGSVLATARRLGRSASETRAEPSAELDRMP